MLILGIVAAVLMITICITAIVHLLGKYSKAKDEAEKQRVRAVVAEDAARVAAGGRPIPGSGVDRSEIPPVPEAPPNRTSTGRALTQPRPRPRPRQSIEDSFSNLFDNIMSEQMNQAFAGVSQAVNRVAEQASQLATTSAAIARDARVILGLGFTQSNIELNQSRSSNLQHLSLIDGVRSNTITALQRLERSNRGAEHMNWGQLVREFMRMIEDGELTFTEDSNGVSLRVNRQRGAESSPGVQSGASPQTPHEPEPEKLFPTRFEREDVI